MRTLPLKTWPAVVVALIASMAPLASTAPAAADPAHPNIVMVLTDDQSINTLQKMPNVQALAATGTTFPNAFVSDSLCSPSRTTILTGLSSGHDGVWTNGDEKSADAAQVGGYSGFEYNGDDARTIPNYLQAQLGYRTGMYGKFLNNYVATGDGPPVVPGWTDFHAFAGTGSDGGNYYDYDLTDGSLNADGTYHTTHYGSSPADYSTNVLADQAVQFLQAQTPDHPFFLYFAPHSPHGPITPGPGDRAVNAPGSFASPSYNEANVSDKPLYIQKAPEFPATRAAYLQHSYDKMYGSLASVDRAVGRFEATLSPDALANTMFIYMSDNGETWGDHRWVYKVAPYERSVRVPLIVRMPGQTDQSTVTTQVMDEDIAPTIYDLAGVTPSDPTFGDHLDGQSVLPLLTGQSGFPPRDGILLEHQFYPSKNSVPSYCGIRTAKWKYVLYKSGFEELYSMTKDSDELRNIAPSKPTLDAQLRSETKSMCDPAPSDFTTKTWG